MQCEMPYSKTPVSLGDKVNASHARDHHTKLLGPKCYPLYVTSDVNSAGRTHGAGIKKSPPACSSGLYRGKEKLRAIDMVSQKLQHCRMDRDWTMVPNYFRPQMLPRTSAPPVWTKISTD